jgi:hypothetical protein
MKPKRRFKANDAWKKSSVAQQRLDVEHQGALKIASVTVSTN